MVKYCQWIGSGSFYKNCSVSMDFFDFFSLVNFIASNGVSQLPKGYFEGPRDEKKEVKTEKKKKKTKQNKTNDLNY